MSSDLKTAVRAECGNPRRYDRGECNWPRCGCPGETVNDRDCASELRAWLTTYSGLRVSRRDAENLIDFLIKAGWMDTMSDGQRPMLPDGTPVEDILTELREARAALAASRSLLRSIRYATIDCKSSEVPAAIRKIREMIDNG